LRFNMASLPPLEPTISQLDALSVESLIYEKQRLENSIFHLVRSNEDMKEFDENDKEFQLAIKENEDLIARHREKIRIIQDLLKKRQQNGNNCITIENTETVQVENTQENNNNNAPINVQNEEMEEPEDGIYL
ncbi:13156_t:CDS:2, partial [Rhizophagus irregularis]